MTPEEIINEVLVPGTSVVVLGSFERRVTVYAQQVRALNLVDAVLSRSGGLLSSERRDIPTRRSNRDDVPLHKLTGQCW